MYNFMNWTVIGLIVLCTTVKPFVRSKGVLIALNVGYGASFITTLVVLADGMHRMVKI